jgi:hypothetical protein
VVKTLLKQLIIEQFIESLFKTICKNFIKIKSSINFKLSGFRLDKKYEYYVEDIEYYYNNNLYVIFLMVSKEDVESVSHLKSKETIFLDMEYHATELTKFEIEIGQHDYMFYRSTEGNFRNMEFGIESSYGRMYEIN